MVADYSKSGCSSIELEVVQAGRGIRLSPTHLLAARDITPDLTSWIPMVYVANVKPPASLNFPQYGWHGGVGSYAALTYSHRKELS